MSDKYSTHEWKGSRKQDYYHNEYRAEGDYINKYKCNRHKEFDGHENNWITSERKVGSWNKNDSNMPDWLKDKFK